MDPSVAAKILGDSAIKLKTPGKAVNYVKWVVANVKSPLDTTIYAPALNLTPDKTKQVQPADKVPMVTADQDILKFLQNIRLQNNDDTMPLIPEHGEQADLQPSTSRANNHGDGGGGSHRLESTSEGCCRQLCGENKCKKG